MEAALGGALAVLWPSCGGRAGVSGGKWWAPKCTTVQTGPAIPCAAQTRSLAESRKILDGPASSSQKAYEGLGSVVDMREILDGPLSSVQSRSITGELVDSRHILITPDYRPPVGFEGGELRPPQGIGTMSLLPAGAALNAQMVPSEDATSEFFAARLSAGNQNREVTAVGYRLVGGAWECDSGMEHRVRVWKESRYGMIPVQSFLVEESKDAMSEEHH